MIITVNGEPRKYGNACSVRDLLQDMDVPGERVAVVVNDDVVSPRRRGELLLREGDRVEILTLAAGG